MRSGAEYDVAIFKKVMIRMRDGVRLAADIYRPVVDGEVAQVPLPAILVRTSYDRTAPFFVSDAEYFSRRGYVVVVQDLRGRYESEGRGQYFHVFTPTEGADGYDTVEWIGQQHWCTGKVGMAGCSHMAIVQNALALYNPPSLAAMIIENGPSNAYHTGYREGGAFMLTTLGALLYHAVLSQEALDDPIVRERIVAAMRCLRGWLKLLPYKPGFSPLSAVPNLEKVFFDMFNTGEYNELWKNETVNYEESYAQHADVPTLYVGGWWDQFILGTLRNYTGLSATKKQPVKVIIGPWAHGGASGARHMEGDVDFGPEAPVSGNLATDYNDLCLRWFDRWLKGIDNGAEEDPAVRIFVMGGGNGGRNEAGRLNHGGRWRNEAQWPLARAHDTPYYLHPDGELSPEKPQGSVPPSSYLFDPRHPVPTISGNSAGFMELVEMVPATEGQGYWRDPIPLKARMREMMKAEASHQKEEPDIFGCEQPYPLLASRPDVLVFQTPPLVDDLEVTGPITVRLWANSAALDTDFTAKLVDVYPFDPDYPDGFHMGISDSIIRARYRNGWEKEELMVPGEIYEFAITLYPTSNVFKAGHRIRLDVSSSNFPRFDVNPNTGEPMGRHTRVVTAENSIYHDADHPSHIALPIVGSD